MRRATPTAIRFTPVLLALVLSASTLTWHFLWDDFDFLGRSATLSLSDLIPSKDVIFYRPLSREVYFWLLYHVGGASPIAAHAASAAIVAGILLLVMSIARRLAGTRAGVISALVLAASGAAPLALGWISAVQDLLCCLFVLTAIRLQLSGRSMAAALAMAAALLSKETAIAFAPIPVVVAYLMGRERSSALRAGIAQGLVLTAWAAIHPSIRGLALGSGTVGSSSNEYVAFQGARAGQAAMEGLALSLNVPWTAPMSLPSHLLPWALAGTAVLAGGILWLYRLGRNEADQNVSGDGSRAGSTILAVTGAMAWIGPILFTSLVVHRWFTYYAFLPAAGLSLLAGLLLRHSRLVVVLGALTLFLWVGIGFRGAQFDPDVPSELNFREADLALTRIEHEFKRLHRALPPDANVFISVQARGHGGLYRHLLRAQPLRVWYREPRLWVLDPNRRRDAGGEDFLFWITPELEVCEINTITLDPRGPNQVISLAQYQKALRGYAFGLAGSGGVDRAVQILTTMPEPSAALQAFDRRAAAALYFAVGRDGQAEQVLSKAPKFNRAESMSAAAALLIEPISGLDLDLAAMRAFDLLPTDVDALRTMMRRLDASHATGAASRMALRVLAQAPGDPEAARVVREATQAPHTKEIVKPVPYDIPQ
ncbi:MAG TPA: hypothetical protein VFX78_06915 [Candidatus Eisenbacteria bacterium]|nr:hypothetical protein [Candidatus Eisenbacteria bacterium]